MDTLRALGQKTEIPGKPDVSILEAVPNPHKTDQFAARFTCPEFSSLCPVTGQPDYATFVIDYVPKEALLESKSLKLYLFAYRNHRGFHEACSTRIARDIFLTIDPYWLRLVGYWNARGGIPIDVFIEIGDQPDHVFIPMVEPASTYRPRG